MAQPEHVTHVAQRGPYDWIGSSVPKVDALDKALGITQYVGDMQMTGMLHARICWSGVPHAVIHGIDTSDAEKVPGVWAVLTASDIPGVTRYGLAVQDQRKRYAPPLTRWS